MWDSCNTINFRYCVSLNVWRKQVACGDTVPPYRAIGALQPDRNKTIQEVWVITAKGNIFKANRKMVFDESIYERLTLL